MSLKQHLFANDSIKQLPSFLNLMEKGLLPNSELNSLYSSISKLISGSFSQRKVGLSFLRNCLINMHQTNKVGENIELLLKWWKAVVNCMKSRYSPDCTYKLACTNAIILCQVSKCFIDLLVEGRSHVPTMVLSCTSHVCSESFDLLLIISRLYPANVGKLVDDIQTFCLAHVHDKFHEKSAEIIAQISCVGPAGKNFCNYSNSWNKSCLNSVVNLNNLLCQFTGKDNSSVQSTVLQQWQFASSIADSERANKEISYLFQYVKSLLQIDQEFSVIFPLQQFEMLIKNIRTSFIDSQSYDSNISEQFVKMVIINHAAKEFLGLLSVLIYKMKTSLFIIQLSIEDMLVSFLQQSFQERAVVNILKELIERGCVLLRVPYVMLLDRLMVQNFHTKGPVSKKQKTEQFSTFTFESSTLGYHDEGVMITVLGLINQVLVNHGLSTSQLKRGELESKCQEIISRGNHFSSEVIHSTYRVLMTLSSHAFEHGHSLRLSSTLKCAASATFVKNQICGIEPHFHPESHQFCCLTPLADRNGKVGDNHRSNQELETISDQLWGKEHDVFFEDLPHKAAQSEVVTDQIDEVKEQNGAECDDSSIQEIDVHDIHTNKFPEHANNESMSMEEESFRESPQVLVQFENSETPCDLEHDNSLFATSLVKGVKSSELNDLLASFVDEPPSDDETSLLMT